MLPSPQLSSSGFWRVSVVGTEIVIGDRIRRAFTPIDKMIGLLNRSGLEPGEGLLIEETSMIHMFFMRFAIDCVYLDHALKITKIAPRVLPFLASWSGLPPARHTLELPAGRCEDLELRTGQVLRFDPVEPAPSKTSPTK